MPVLSQHFPEVTNLLEVRTPSKGIRYWLNRRYAVVLEPTVIASLFLDALPPDSLRETGQGDTPVAVPDRPRPTDIDVLGYDEASRSALLHIRNTQACFLCSFDTMTKRFSSQPVSLTVMLQFIGSRQFLHSMQRSIDVIGAARRWLEKRR